MDHPSLLAVVASPQHRTPSNRTNGSSHDIALKGRAESRRPVAASRLNAPNPLRVHVGRVGSPETSSVSLLALSKGGEHAAPRCHQFTGIGAVAPVSEPKTVDETVPPRASQDTKVVPVAALQVASPRGNWINGPQAEDRGKALAWQCRRRLWARTLPAASAD